MTDEQEELFDLKEISKPFNKGREFGESRFNEHYQLLSSGKSFYAYGGVIGIGPDSSIYWGYDEPLPDFLRDETGYETTFLHDSNLTPSEYQELADVMITRWNKFKEVWKEVGYVERADQYD